MKKYLLLLLLLPLAGCVKSSDLHFGGITSSRITAVGTTQTGLALAVKAANTSGTNLTLVRADLRLYHGDELLAEATVGDKVKLPRRFDGTVEIPLRVRMGDGGLFGALGMMSMLYANGPKGTTVSGQAVVRAGMFRKKFEINRMDTEQLMQKLGVSWSDIKKQIKL